MKTASWDIFCAVVDHYGDIGVCWRLSRQLAAEHRSPVRLWVDDLTAFRRLEPAVDVLAESQHLAGVEIRHWGKPFTHTEPADIAVEAFGCNLPDSYIAAMQRARPPVWINLEYLSAETWTRGCHRLASPHPRLPLTKYFFFPGFVPESGGLLREHGLLQARAAFGPAEAAAFRAAVGLPAPLPDELRVSLFCYPREVVPALLETWAAGGRAVCCAVPEGTAVADVAAWAGAPLEAGLCVERGSLRLCGVPFLSQPEYDRLLWSCDLNFVRGEDSFVRAQWAQQPMVWQIYLQPDGAHWKKLQAFLDLYAAALPHDARTDLTDLWEAWNGAAPVHDAWERAARHLPALASRARTWAAVLAQQADLAGELLKFAEEKRTG